MIDLTFGLKNEEREKALEAAAEHFHGVAVRELTTVRTNLQKEFPDFTTEEGQEYISLNLPYDCVIRLIGSMMQGRSRNERHAICEMLNSDIEEFAAIERKELQAKYAEAFHASSTAIRDAITNVWKKGDWQSEEKSIFMSALIASAVQCLLNAALEKEKLEWEDYKGFLSLIEECLVDTLAYGEQFESKKEI